MTDLDQGSTLSDLDPVPTSPKPTAPAPKRLVFNARKIFTGMVVLGLLFGIVILSVPPFVFRARPLEKMLAGRIEQMTGGPFAYKSFETSYFPFLTVRYHGIEVHSLTPAAFDLQAGTLSLRLARIPLLWGRFRAHAVEISDAKGAVAAGSEIGKEIVAFERARAKAGPFRAGRDITIEFSGVFPGGENHFEGKGSARVGSLERPEWKDAAMDMNFRVEKAGIALLARMARQVFHFNPAGGETFTSWSFNKAPGDPWLAVRSSTEIRQFSYRLSEDAQSVPSPVFDIQLNGQGQWNPEAETLRVEKISMHLPAGNLEMSGEVRMATKEIQDLRIAATEVVLESIPQYVLGLKEVIPLNIGFSGQSNFEVALSGTWDHLSIHVNWDLTQALLTYARFFSKPKELPLNLAFDFLLKDQHVLGGDFSVRLKDAAMKGSLTAVDLSTGDGQINMITNKFNLEGWQDLIPPMQGYKLSGGGKVLANFKGDLRKIEGTESMFNISLEEAGIKDPQGRGLEGVHLALDLSPLSLEIRDTHFKLGEDMVQTHLLVYDLRDKPLLDFSLQAEKTQPSLLMETAEALAASWLAEPQRASFAAATSWIQNYFPEGQTAANLSLQIKSEDAGWVLPELSFEAFGGKARLSGNWETLKPEAPYQLGFNFQKMSLAQWPGLRSLDSQLLEGNLFLKGSLRGRSAPAQPAPLEGEGTLLVTNGEFRSIDLMAAVGALSDFTDLAGRASGKTAFHDLHADFKVSGTKLITENLSVLGDDFTVQASGEFGLDRFLNYRLQVFLEESLLGAVPAAVPAPEGQAPKEFLGPVPMLVSGLLDHPDLKPDPSLGPDLRAELLKKKNHQPLRNFLPEDAFALPAADTAKS